jgi:L-malate glycosyltransferase
VGELSRLPLSIFVAHPSSLLTDYRPHGDGLLAHRFIVELAQRGHRLHIAAESADLRRQLPDNVRLHPLGDPDPARPVERLRYMWRMRRLFQTVRGHERIDIIHQLNPVHVGISLALADSGVPIVLGPYVPDWPDRRDGLTGADAAGARLADGLRSAVASAQQRRAAALLLSSPAAGSKVRLGPGSPTAVHELPYGIDERLWTPDGVRAPAQDILFVGRLHAHKGIFVLLDAFERLASTLPLARLRLAGSGPAEDDLRACVQRGPYGDRIELMGNLDRDATVRAMRACDVFCLPSFGEPFGLGALEAMACAKPVVVTDAGGLRYLVDGAGGRRVSVGDADALRTALCELLIDPELRRRMGSHNRERVQLRYTWQRVVDRLEQIYLQTSAAPRRAKQPSVA